MPLCNCSKQVGLPCSSEMIRWQRKACTFHNVTAGFSLHDSMDSAALCIVYRGLVGWEMGGGGISSWPFRNAQESPKLLRETGVWNSSSLCSPEMCLLSTGSYDNEIWSLWMRDEDDSDADVFAFEWPHHQESLWPTLKLLARLIRVLNKVQQCLEVWK